MVQEENDKRGCRENESAPLYLPKNRIIVKTIYIIRAFCFIGWAGALIYSAYEIYKKSDEYFGWESKLELNQVSFSKLLNRSRDFFDFEWEMFTLTFSSKLLYWYSVYILVVIMWGDTHPKRMVVASSGMSMLVSLQLIGIVPTLFIWSLPFGYWALLKFRSTILIWAITFVMLIFVERLLHQKLFSTEEPEVSHNFAIITTKVIALCVSFSLDSLNRSKMYADSVLCLWTAISHCFYFPLMVSGPFILFDDYEKHIFNKQQKCRGKVLPKLCLLMKNTLRVAIVFVILEFIHHYMQCNRIAATSQIFKTSNLWVVLGCVYWMAQCFTLKYKVLYGTTTFLAEFEGMQMPPVPVCGCAYVHRYSVLWKDFDRGLYNFLIKYIYIPGVRMFKLTEERRRISGDVQKLLVSFLCFVFIYVWHGTSFYIFVWAAFNFLGLTIERIGSAIKLRVDHKFNIRPVVWDFIVEPIVTVPLAMMSLLNGSVFTGSLETCILALQKLGSASTNQLFCLVLIMYCFTHVAVHMRTQQENRRHPQPKLHEREKQKAG